MRRHQSAVVVAGWALLNAVLLTVLAVYGENTLVYWLWGGVVLLLALTAGLVLVSSRSGPEQHTRYRVPDRGAAAVPAAAFGFVLVALAFVHGWWLLALAGPLLAVAAALAVRGTTAREE
ncbi:hypothetical protein [Streptomyces sp. NPDC006997]|uniref:hypothetical protein n=1 Tax=Streptomyces sp. NPDC006997 TaxID=3155356 RepID=UPI0033D4058F